MKRKFYDDPPKLEMASPCCWADKNQYTKEINWVAKHMFLDVNKFRVDDITFGDPVLFYCGKYMGYLDNLFYRAFDIDDFEDWWGFYN
jgi:hypothetical protein